MALEDPFQRVDLLIEYLDAVAGSGKSHEALMAAAEGVRRGEKYIFRMPTLELITEWHNALRDRLCPDIAHLIYAETSEHGDNEEAVVPRILHHITHNTDGCILFITHAAY